MTVVVFPFWAMFPLWVICKQERFGPYPDLERNCLGDHNSKSDNIPYMYRLFGCGLVWRRLQMYIYGGNLFVCLHIIYS